MQDSRTIYSQISKIINFLLIVANLEYSNDLSKGKMKFLITQGILYESL